MFQQILPSTPDQPCPRHGSYTYLLVRHCSHEKIKNRKNVYLNLQDKLHEQRATGEAIEYLVPKDQAIVQHEQPIRFHGTDHSSYGSVERRMGISGYHDIQESYRRRFHPGKLPLLRGLKGGALP